MNKETSKEKPYKIEIEYKNKYWEDRVIITDFKRENVGFEIYNIIRQWAIDIIVNWKEI